VVNPVCPQAPSAFARSIPERSHRTDDRRVAEYRYLCRRGARKFLRGGLERCDLEQVAALGLIKAARRYDPATGTPFEAYAWQTIVGELMHFVRDYEHAVRVPRRIKALEPRLRRAYDSCAGKLGREPSDAEVARELGVIECTVTAARQARASGAMLPLDDSSVRAIAVDVAAALEDRLMIETALRALSRVQRRVVVGSYLWGFSHAELGRTLGCSARQVSRIHRAALERMQSAWASPA